MSRQNTFLVQERGAAHHVFYFEIYSNVLVNGSGQRPAAAWLLPLVAVKGSVVKQCPAADGCVCSQWVFVEGIDLWGLLSSWDSQLAFIRRVMQHSSSYVSSAGTWQRFHLFSKHPRATPRMVNRRDGELHPALLEHNEHLEPQSGDCLLVRRSVPDLNVISFLRRPDFSIRITTRLTFF